MIAVIKSCLTILFLFAVLLSNAQKLPSDWNNLDVELLNQFIIKEVNYYRKKAKKEPLRNDNALKQAADDHSRYLVDKGELTHVQKRNKEKKSPKDRTMYYGGSYGAVGENIQFIYPGQSKKMKGERKAAPIDDYERLAKYLVLNWRNSPPHYANMINENFDVSYTTVAYDPETKRLYATQLFGSEPYLYPKEVETIPKFKPVKDRFCKKCLKADDLGKTAATGVHVSNDSIFFYSDHKRTFKKSFGWWGAGLAADIILKDQFPCDGKNKINGARGYQGFLLEPVYQPHKKPQNLLGWRRVLVYLGSVPEFVDQDYEVNLSIINRKRDCVPYIYHNLPSSPYAQLNIHPKIDTLSRITHFIVKDSSEYTIRFGKSESLANSDEMAKINSALKKKKAAITKAKIKAFASVEGSTENNLRLQEERANQLINLMKEHHADSMLTEINTYENFEAFYKDINGTSFEWMAQLDTTSLKDTIRNNPNLSQELETVLENHRYAWMKIYTTHHDPVVYTKEKAIAYFNSSIYDKKIADAKRYQAVLIKYLVEGEMSLQEFEQVKVPRREEFFSLLNNYYQALMMVDTVENRLKETMMEYDTLYAISSKNSAVNTNYAIMYYNYHSQYIYQKSRKEIEDPMKNIEKIKKVDKQVMKQLKLNSILYASYCNELIENYGAAERKILELKKFVGKAKLSNEDKFSVAKVFSYYHMHEDAYKLMQGVVKSDSPTIKQLMFVSKLLFTQKDELKEREQIQVLKRIADKAGEEFCDFFNSPDLNFQVLDEEVYKSIYCERCGDE